MIDQKHNVSLYCLSSRGFELAERYQDGAGLDHLPSPLRRTLAGIAADREALMERFRRTVVDEGGLPKAGNPEREWLENLVDRWYSLSGSESVVTRLRQADQEWLEEIRRITAADDWPPPLQQVLEDLARHVEQSHQRLQQTTPEPLQSD